MQIVKVLGLFVGPTCYNFCEKSDAQRINFTERSISEQAKETRKSMLSSREELDDTRMYSRKSTTLWGRHRRLKEI